MIMQHYLDLIKYKFEYYQFENLDYFVKDTQYYYFAR